MLYTGIQIETVNFTEAQGGKGACDREAASTKKHVRILNPMVGYLE